MAAAMAKQNISMDFLIDSLEIEPIHRISGTAVFMTISKEGAQKACKRLSRRPNAMETTAYLSRETIVPPFTKRMLPARARLFAVMPKNATSASDFLRIPTNHVEELGTQLII